MSLELGWSRKLKSGERATIIAIRDENDIDVQFDDGTILKNIPYRRLYLRSITNPTKFRVTFDKVKEKFDERDYILISTKYEGARSPLQYICKKHPNEVQTTNWFTISQGRGCKKCGYERVSKSLSSQKRTPYLIVMEKFKASGLKLLTSEKDYYASLNPTLEFICQCSPNTIQQKKWKAFGQAPHCSKCFGEEKNKQMRHDGYNEFIKLCEGKGYKVISKEDEYVNSNIALSYICPKHGQHHISLSHLRMGEECPDCAVGKSYGELKIADWLNKYNFKYERQKKFKNLRGKNGISYLPYDFYLPELNFLIEYQGEFHDGSVFKINPKMQSEKQFEEQQYRDKKKKTYAIENGYAFLEIWYWDYNNIEEILKKELNKHK